MLMVFFANIWQTSLKFASPFDSHSMRHLLEISKESLVSHEDWSTLRLVRHDALVESVSSYLIVKGPNFDVVYTIHLVADAARK
jgi:hypothetical protein